jgi:hypothetical protein
MNMPRIGIATGILLILTGLAGYFLGGKVSVTALIPAFFGVAIAIASAVGSNERFLKHAMHAAATLGLLGFIAPLGRLIPKAIKDGFELNMASGSMIAMSIICAGFVMLCVKSFVDVRRARVKS